MHSCPRRRTNFLYRSSTAAANSFNLIMSCTERDRKETQNLFKKQNFTFLFIRNHRTLLSSPRRKTSWIDFWAGKENTHWGRVGVMFQFYSSAEELTQVWNASCLPQSSNSAVTDLLCVRYCLFCWAAGTHSLS